MVHTSLHTVLNVYDPKFEWNIPAPSYCGIAKSVIGPADKVPEDEEDREDGTGHFYSAVLVDNTVHEHDEVVRVRSCTTSHHGVWATAALRESGDEEGPGGAQRRFTAAF